MGCDGSGKCSKIPVDDVACGVIDCDKLDSKCVDYHDLTDQRCEFFGACKKANSHKSCARYTALSCGDGGPLISAP